MYILDNVKKIKKLDSAGMVESIGFLDNQIKQAWQESGTIKIPDDYRDIKKVVVNGMGGSGLGTHIIQSIFFEKLKMPIGNIHSYILPGMVDKETLYIISSYSGNTEEPVNTFRQANRRGAKVLGISSGGKLGQWIKEGDLVGYLFIPKNNPCGQPRMGIGYSVAGLLGLLKKCGVVKVSDREIEEVVRWLKKINKRFEPQVLVKDNMAKQIAIELGGKIAIVVVADFLAGNGHALSNQINENAKNFANYFIISEMNHHLLEGLSNPKFNSRDLKFLLIESDLYHKNNQKRIEITKEVFKKNRLDYVSCRLEGKTKLEQSFEMLALGSYVSFYLAILNGIDPSPIPWVDYFKNQLEQ